MSTVQLELSNPAMPAVGTLSVTPEKSYIVVSIKTVMPEVLVPSGIWVTTALFHDSKFPNAPLLSLPLTGNATSKAQDSMDSVAAVPVPEGKQIDLVVKILGITLALTPGTTAEFTVSVHDSYETVNLKRPPFLSASSSVDRGRRLPQISTAIETIIGQRAREISNSGPLQLLPETVIKFVAYHKYDTIADKPTDAHETAQIMLARSVPWYARWATEHIALTKHLQAWAVLHNVDLPPEPYLSTLIEQTLYGIIKPSELMEPNVVPAVFTLSEAAQHVAHFTLWLLKIDIIATLIHNNVHLECNGKGTPITLSTGGIPFCDGAPLTDKKHSSICAQQQPQPSTAHATKVNHTARRAAATRPSAAATLSDKPCSA